MSIPTSCVITNRDKLAQDVWKGNLLLAKAVDRYYPRDQNRSATVPVLRL